MKSMDTKTLITVIAMEECGELTRALSKTLRHGTTKNLVEEIGDVIAMIYLVKDQYNLSEDEILKQVTARTAKVEKQLNSKNSVDKKN